MEETTVHIVSVTPSTEKGSKHTLSNQAVQVLVVGALKTKVSSADVVDSLIVDHEGTVGVLKGGVGSENGVVGLDHGCSGLGRWVDTKLQLDLLAEVDGETLHEESPESRTSSTTERVENKETLQTRAVVGNMANLVQDLVDQLLSDGVVTTGVVV